MLVSNPSANHLHAPLENTNAIRDEATYSIRAVTRAFNLWLINEWLVGYPHDNVAVFDYFNVLTSNGSASRIDDPSTTEEPNDAGWADGNHHRWNASAIQHIHTIDNDFSAYPSGDSHPTSAGHQKATTEFVQLLNVYANRWLGGSSQPGPLVIENATVDDDQEGQSWGNGDGMADCGETIEWWLQVTNQGTATADSVTVSLSTSDTNVTLMEDSAVCPNIPPGGTVAASDPLVFSVHGDAPHGHDAAMDLTFEASEGGPWVDAADVQIQCLEDCAADLEPDGVVDEADLAIGVASWGAAVSPADLDGDGVVSVCDLCLIVGQYGPCP